MARAEVEGVVQEASQSHPLDIEIGKKVRRQLKAALPGIALPARELERGMPEGVAHLAADRFKEATLAALSGLPKD